MMWRYLFCFLPVVLYFIFKKIDNPAMRWLRKHRGWVISVVSVIWLVYEITDEGFNAFVMWPILFTLFGIVLIVNDWLVRAKQIRRPRSQVTDLGLFDSDLTDSLPSDKIYLIQVQMRFQGSIMMKIGKLLRKVRVELGLTQKEMAGNLAKSRL